MARIGVLRRKRLTMSLFPVGGTLAMYTMPARGGYVGLSSGLPMYLPGQCSTIPLIRFGREKYR